MASAAYFDHDAARYGPKGSRSESLAPTLTSAPRSASNVWHAADEPV